MARIRLVDPASLPNDKSMAEGVSSELKDYYFINNRVNIGRVFRSLAHNRNMYELHKQLACTLWSEDATQLTPKETELITLVVSRGTGGQYSWESHVPVALAVGLSRDEIVSIGTEDYDNLDEPYATLARFVDAFATKDVTDELFDHLTEHYSESKIASINMLSGFFVLCGYLIESYGLNPPGPANVGAEEKESPEGFIGWELEHLET